jgi:hypothetical protein
MSRFFLVYADVFLCAGLCICACVIEHDRIGHEIFRVCWDWVHVQVLTLWVCISRDVPTVETPKDSGQAPSKGHFIAGGVNTSEFV